MQTNITVKAIEVNISPAISINLSGIIIIRAEIPKNVQTTKNPIENLKIYFMIFLFR